VGYAVEFEVMTMHDQAIAAVVRFLQNELPALLTTGDDWRLTLHGGRPGDIRVEVLKFKEIVQPIDGMTNRPFGNLKE